MRSWEPLLCAEWRAAAREMGLGLSADRVCLRVATDCSGLGALVLALGAMGIRHKHVSSCDCATSARAFLEANCAKPGGPLRPCGSAAPMLSKTC